MRPRTEMLGLTRPLHNAPALAACQSLLRKIIVPGVDKKLQGRDRREIAVQGCRRHIRAERFRHGLHHRLAVLEVLDELSRRRQVLADLVRHACLGGEAIHENLR